MATSWTPANWRHKEMQFISLSWLLILIIISPLIVRGPQFSHRYLFYYVLVWDKSEYNHRHCWVIFRGGPTANHSVLPKFNHFLPTLFPVLCQVTVLCAKLLCQTVLPMGKHGRWKAAKQSKVEEKRENMAETIGFATKNGRKQTKIWSFTNYLLPSSHFCPAKLPFLSCQSPIFVLPS